MRLKARNPIVVALATMLMLPALAGASPRSDEKDSRALRNAVDANHLRPYLKRIEDISAHHGPAGTTAPDGHAADGHGEYRLAGTAGDEEMARYIANQLDRAGLAPNLKHFPFDFYRELSPAHFEQTAPTPTTYSEPADFATMDYSGPGDVTGTVVPTNDVQIPPGPTPSSSNSGCEAADFPTAPAGPAVALIQRGSCDFRVKALNAQAAGYDAVVIFNEGQPGRTETVAGTLGGAGVSIPVLGASFALGEQLYEASQSGPVTVHVTTNTISEQRESHNVVASTRKGAEDRVVLVGAHTDSTIDGPAVNDDGTGIALGLGLAREFGKKGIKPRNQVRFGFWGAEESGLIGSEYYASQLSPSEVKSIAVNLAFDMLGSDNAARLVYDGDGSSTGIPGPEGSGAIEAVFNDYYAAQGKPTDPQALDGRTDYASFTALGIPAGGITSGAEVPKTAEQQQRYGGVAGQPYYVCYHQACDTVATIFGSAGDPFSPIPPEPGLQAFRNAGLGKATLTDQAGGAAHTVLTFARMRWPETAAAPQAKTKAEREAKGGDYVGPRLRK